MRRRRRRRAALLPDARHRVRTGRRLQPRQPVRALSTASSANGLGNLLNRVLASIVQEAASTAGPGVDGASCAHRPRTTCSRATSTALRQAAARAARRGARRNRALEAIWELVAAANKYVDQHRAVEARQARRTRRGSAQVVYTVLESAARPRRDARRRSCRGRRDELLRAARARCRSRPRSVATSGPSAWGGLPAGTQTRPGQGAVSALRQGSGSALARSSWLPKAKPVEDPKPRTRRSAAAPTPNPLQAGRAASSPPKTPASAIDDFAKVELRVARGASGRARAEERQAAAARRSTPVRLGAAPDPGGHRQALRARRRWSASASWCRQPASRAR